jgi:hypothetical protein
MLTLTKETQMDKAKKTLREVASYADEVIRDERLRADIRAAVGHGAEASNRVKAELGADGMTTLAADKKLRRSLRAMLDDLDRASERMRRKPRHRARNALLLLAGAVTAAQPVRRFVSGLQNVGHSRRTWAARESNRSHERPVTECADT